MGCPWSMLFLAVQLMPWVIEMRDLAPCVRVRILADDVLLTTSAQGQETDEELVEMHFDALEATDAYFQDMRALLSLSKSHSAASNPALRRMCKRRRMQSSGLVIPVLLHIRDLGSTLNSGRRHVAPTITKRFAEAVKVVRAFAALPCSDDIQANLIAAKAIPGAIYGAPTSPIPANAAGRLAAAIATARAHRAAPTGLPTMSLRDPKVETLTRVLPWLLIGAWRSGGPGTPLKAFGTKLGRCGPITMRSSTRAFEAGFWTPEPRRGSPR